MACGRCAGLSGMSEVEGRAGVAQVHLLKEMRPEALAGVEVSSVDGFQGREKEAVIISMVRAAETLNHLP